MSAGIPRAEVDKINKFAESLVAAGRTDDIPQRDAKIRELADTFWFMTPVQKALLPACLAPLIEAEVAAGDCYSVVDFLLKFGQAIGRKLEATAG